MQALERMRKPSQSLDGLLDLSLVGGLSRRLFLEIPETIPVGPGEHEVALIYTAYSGQTLDDMVMVNRVDFLQRHSLFIPVPVGGRRLITSVYVNSLDGDLRETSQNNKI